MVWGILPFGQMAGHNAYIVGIFAALVAVGIYGLVALAVGSIFQEATVALTGLAVAVVTGIVGTLVWLLALSHAASQIAQLAFQHAVVLLVCRSMILVVALVALVAGLYFADKFIYDERFDGGGLAFDAAIAALLGMATVGVVFGSMAFSY
jgi:hypothetical protein